MRDTKTTICVVIACPGLGRIRRGYESFFRNCHDAIAGFENIDLRMYKGAGDNTRIEKAIWNLNRTRATAATLGALVGRSGYFVEQFTFFVALLPRLLLRRVDVVYVSDVVLGNLLRLAQRLPFFSYRILFNNNGPAAPHLLSRWNHVQQVSPQYAAEATESGIPSCNQTLLPSAVPIAAKFASVNSKERMQLRHRLGLPIDRKIVISVGSLSKSRKRMDHTIREVAKMPLGTRPHLVLIGARAADTPEIESLCSQLLGKDGFTMRTVSPNEVGDYYRAGDVFVLSSTDEGFGLVYVEALSHGLRVIAHEYTTARFVLDDHGIYCDMTVPGELARTIETALLDPDSPDRAARRHESVYRRFSWEKLRPRYVELFREVATK